MRTKRIEHLHFISNIRNASDTCIHEYVCKRCVQKYIYACVRVYIQIDTWLCVRRVCSELMY